MAISGAVYSSKQLKLGYAVESTFGTAIADDQAFVLLPEFGSVSIDYGLTQDLSRKNRGDTYPHAYDVDTYTSQTGGIRTITISDLILRKDDAPYFLYALFQNVTESATTPYGKTFTFSGTLPDFTSNAGMFMTIGLDKYIASYDEKFTSCILREATFKADLVGGDGRVKCDLTFISGFSATTTANFSGTWTSKAQEYLDMNASTNNQIDDADIVVYNWDVSINNSAVRIGNTSAGACQSYALNSPEPTIDLNFTAKYDPNTQGELAAFLAGTSTKIELGIGSGAADGDFVVGGYMDYTGYSEPEQEQGAAMSLSGRFTYHTSVPPSIIVADANDLSW